MKKLLLAVLCALVSAPSLWAQAKVLQLPSFEKGTKWIVHAGVGFNGVVGGAKDVQKDVWAYQHNYGDGDFKKLTGYNFGIAFSKPMGKYMYWGMELELTQRGYKTEVGGSKSYESSAGGHSNNNVSYSNTSQVLTHSVSLSPFNFGYRYKFLKRMAVDVHLSPYASFDFAGKMKWDNSKSNYSYGTVLGKPFSGGSNHQDSGDMKVGDIDCYRRYDAGLRLGVGYWYGHFNVDFTWTRGFVPMYDNFDDEVATGKKTKEEIGKLFVNSFELRLGYAF